MNAIYPQTVRTGQEKYPKIQIFNKNSDVSPRFDFSYFFEKARSVEHVHLKLKTFHIMLSRSKHDWKKFNYCRNTYFGWVKISCFFLTK